eukprot:gnl/Dysnectes_brevis/2101_a2438_2064.p1 GENE.gnl/Dysnectes_brevis/2101_a2438_2064~~gnl/Dysnectes_brevis/2101_a2438_2064.p1  ORF type:complete len:169 (+),score=24.89 gnl/Dysnectes_brevis/2101_a2438_2064:82-588(+)
MDDLSFDFSDTDISEEEKVDIHFCRKCSALAYPQALLNPSGVPQLFYQCFKCNQQETIPLKIDEDGYCVVPNDISPFVVFKQHHASLADGGVKTTLTEQEKTVILHDPIFERKIDWCQQCQMPRMIVRYQQNQEDMQFVEICSSCKTVSPLADRIQRRLGDAAADEPM